VGVKLTLGQRAAELERGGRVHMVAAAGQRHIARPAPVAAPCGACE
jgi:hypothetical protein